MFVLFFQIQQKNNGFCERRRTKIEKTLRYGVKKIAEKIRDETKNSEEKHA